MEKTYQLVKWPYCEAIIKTAKTQDWFDECHIAIENDIVPNKSYFIPTTRVELMKKVTRKNITSHMLTYQLQLVDKSQIEIMDNDDWRFDWSITEEQFTDFKRYSVALLKKTFRCNSKKAKANFEWYWQKFGLRVKNAV